MKQTHHLNVQMKIMTSDRTVITSKQAVDLMHSLDIDTVKTGRVMISLTAGNRVGNICLLPSMKTKELCSTVTAINATRIITVDITDRKTPIPTSDDVKKVKTLKEHLDNIRASLVDHIIISEKRWYSFAEENLN